MRFFIIALAFACAASAAPSGLVTIQKYDGEVRDKHFIVTFKPDASMKDRVQALKMKFSSNVTITNDQWEEPFANTFSGKLSDQALKELRADPSVQSIEEDGLVQVNAIVTQTNAPWGISRLSRNAKQTNQDANALTFSYCFDSTAGSGVDIYVVDTGIYTRHADFNGHARWGATFGGYPSQDGNGHGTHCAGTAAGSRYGVAKSASLIAIKVLSDQGSGWVSDIISSMNYVYNSAWASGRPSIVSMSLGGSVSTSLDNAVTTLTNAGIHVVVATGNSASDARNFSPAQAASAITVGATSITDSIASFSNFGPAVDVFTPGVSITSTWIGSTTAMRSISGTSMSTPHVAGLVAYFIKLQGNASPSAMSTKIKQYSVKNVISGLPAGTGTVNYLARNNVQ